jgi:hypothetical protein
MLRAEEIKGNQNHPLFWFELAGVSWSEFAAGTIQAQPLKSSAFAPLRDTYLNIHESIRGQGEARKIPARNASLAGLGFQVHPPQQVLEARVVPEGIPVGIYTEMGQPGSALQRYASDFVKCLATILSEMNAATVAVGAP